VDGEWLEVSCGQQRPDFGGTKHTANLSFLTVRFKFCGSSYFTPATRNPSCSRIVRIFSV
jgi:hypothetical protein